MRTMLPVIVCALSMVVSRGSIADFQWKNRILVLSGADERIVKLLAEEKAGLEDRDLKVFILSGSGVESYPVDPGLEDEFETRLTPSKEKPMVYLIGKDGRTTLEWTLAGFTFEKLFASIDAMPMRKREMREGN